MRIYALRMQAESSPDDIAKHTALLSALLESATKENAVELVKHYEQHVASNPELLKDQKAFDTYLAGLAIANEGSAVTKLAEASQKRDAALQRPQSDLATKPEV